MFRVWRALLGILVGVPFLFSFALVTLAQEAKQRTTFSVGFIAGLSGQYALLSQRMLAGAELAAEDCNQRLASRDTQLVVIGEDDHLADNKTTLTVVKKLTRVDQVVAIVAWAFGTAEAIKTGLSGERTPILFFWDSNESIPALGSNFYGTGPSMSMQAEVLIRQFLDSQISTVGSLVLVDNWTERMNQLLQRELPARGIKLVTSESILPETTDLRTPLLRMKQREPQALVILSYGPSFITAIRQAKQIWPTVQIYGFGQPESDMQLLGASAEGTVIVSGWAAGTIAERLSEKIAARESVSSSALTPSAIVYGLYAYNSTYLVCKALEQLVIEHAPVNHDSVNAKLRSVSFDAGAGEVAPGRHNDLKEIALEWRSGSFLPLNRKPAVKETEEAATAVSRLKSE